MKMKAKIAAVIMALSVAVSPVSAAAEWQQDPYQNWQWTENGVPVTGWEFINQNWYYFDGNGYMVTGWQKIDGKQYYFNANGTLAIGWAEIGGNWYYFNGSGEMMTGWQRVEGYWYYMNSQGVMQKGWLTYGRDRYYLDENGAMEIGWVEVGDDWYFMNHDGLLQTGMIEVNGEVFYLDGDGKMVKGDVTFGGEKYKFDEETGAATGSKIPKPGKAFDAFGNEAEVTVAGSSGSSGSSGGTTVIYVPVDNGNSGNQGGNWNPGWDDDDDDDNDNPGWNPGGDGDGDGDDNPSGEPPEPVAEDLQLLDAFFESKVPEINADYERDFNVSFDKSSHKVTIEIKNLEKRVYNIRYGNLLHELVNYKDGLVTQYKVGNGQYRNLYRTWENENGSEYHDPIYLGYYVEDFFNAGLTVFSTTGSLIGSTVEVTLRLGNEMETQPYTVEFVRASVNEIVPDNPDCKMALWEMRDGFASKQAVDCEQVGNDVMVYYTLPEDYQYEGINFKYGRYYDDQHNRMLLGWMRPEYFNSPDCTIEEIESGVFKTTFETDIIDTNGRKNHGKYSYTIEFVDDGFLIKNMDLSQFYYDHSSDENNYIGEIHSGPIPEPGITIKAVKDSEVERIEYELDEKGLSFDLPSGSIYDLSIRSDFPNHFLIDGYSISSIYLEDISDVSKNKFRNDGANGAYSYDCIQKEKNTSNGVVTYTYDFGYFDFFIQYIEQNGKKTLVFPQLTAEVLKDLDFSVQIDVHDTFSYQINGSSTSGSYSWTENGLTISHNGSGSFINDDFYINFYVPIEIGGVSVKTINIEYGPYENRWNNYLSFERSDGNIDTIQDVLFADNGNTRTYHFRELTWGVDFRVQISEDGKQISFPDLSEDMLEGNALSVDVTVE